MKEHQQVIKYKNARGCVVLSFSQTVLSSTSWMGLTQRSQRPLERWRLLLFDPGRRLDAGPENGISTLHLALSFLLGSLQERMRLRWLPLLLRRVSDAAVTSWQDMMAHRLHSVVCHPSCQDGAEAPFLPLRQEAWMMHHLFAILSPDEEMRFPYGKSYNLIFLCFVGTEVELTCFSINNRLKLLF